MGSGPKVELGVVFVKLMMENVAEEEVMVEMRVRAESP